MIRVPLYLAIVEWSLLLVLGLLVIILYRQLGRIFSRTKASEVHGPAVGSRATMLEYSNVVDGRRRTLVPDIGRLTLLAFVDPTCPSCEKLVSALEAVRNAGDLADARVLLLITDPPSFLKVSPTFRMTDFEIGRVARADIPKDYNVNATPLLIAVDRSGVVRAAGPAAEIKEVQTFIRAGLLLQQPGSVTLDLVEAD